MIARIESNMQVAASDKVLLLTAEPPRGSCAAKLGRQESNMRVGPFLFVLSFLLVACEPHVPAHSEFTIGMTRAEIRGEFGHPQRIQVLTKTGDQIWGPIEDYWPQVPKGASVEIWSYDSRMTYTDDDNKFEQPGQTQLYFMNDSNEVSGIGFHIEGAVYEGS